MQRRFINSDDGSELYSAGLLSMVESGFINNALRYLDEYTYPAGELNACLVQATVFGLDSVVRSLIAHGADARHKEDGDFGLTPLHYAIKYGHLSSAEILLENGADTMVSPGLNNSPAYYAIKRDSLEMLMLLCRFGLDVNF